MGAENKTPTTLSIDRDIKSEFKIECLRNSVDMSEVVEGMMTDYTRISKELHDERKQRG